MASKFDIHISEIERKETHDLEYSKLVLKFTGKDVSDVLINTLRRILLDDIPTYAFPTECIDIEKNTSVFNNDQMKIRLTQLPLLNMKLDLSYLDDDYWLNVNYASHERNICPLEKNVEIYINAKNFDESIKNITTNDIEYYVDNERTHHQYNEKYPIVLIKLRPTEVFKCKLKAVLGVGERNVIWSGTSNAYYNTETDGKDKTIATLFIESHGQFSEYELLWKACRYMQIKMNKLEEKIKNKYETVYSRCSDIANIELTLDEETYTIGGIITHFLQDLDIVEFAGVGRKNDLVKQITIKVIYKKTVKEPLEPIFNALSQCRNVVKQIENTIYDIGKKYIHKYVK